MSRNIYDLFNERKNGVDFLIEGYEYDFDTDEIEAFESLDAAAEALDAISLESTNEMIELQAAWYLEDLVIESMMYDEFDEGKIKSVMEGSAKEKAAGLGEKIKNMWQKIKQWFVAAFKAITAHFQSGETLVAKYRKEIPGAIQQSKAKVKMRGLSDYSSAQAQIAAAVSRLKATGKTKEQILGIVGISDKSGVKGKVEAIYYPNKEAKEYAISGLKPEEVMKWAGDKKVMIDSLKKQQKDIDGQFKECLNNLKKGDGDKKADEVANFQFGMNIANAMLSHEITCVKNISNVCTAIIRKALSGKHDPNKERNIEAKDTDDVKRLNKNEKKYGKGMLPAPESWEIIDEEEENNDDFEW